MKRLNDVKQHWATRRERGSTALLRLMIWISLNLGWSVSRVLLGLIALYFFASSADARAASRDFLERARGRPATTLSVLRHLFTFCSVILERVFLLANRLERFDIEVQGLEHLNSVLAQGTGCVLLGAHFGSFEVMRAIGRHAPVRVRPLMFRQNAGAVTRVLEALDPAMQDAIIEIGRPDTMLLVRESVQRGEIVGMLADRVPGGGKQTVANFLGSPAAFPTGPFVVVASLGVPALLFYGIRIGPRRYVARFAPFAQHIVLPRTSRERDLRGWVKRYAASLEAECRAHPFNWFNFHRFWETPSDARAQAELGVARARAADGARGGAVHGGEPAAAAMARRADGAARPDWRTARDVPGGTAVRSPDPPADQQGVVGLSPALVPGEDHHRAAARTPGGGR